VTGAGAPDRRRLRFVLVEPLRGGNVGAACRALKNLGFGPPTLVAPACDPHGEEARRMAVNAGDLLERATIHDDLDQALADCTTVVGTTARAGKARRPHPRLDRLAPDLVRDAGVGELAIVFGREDRGLTDEELDRCTHLVHLPGDPAYPSFNLAQAVLLVAYQLRLAALGAEPVPADEAPAGHLEREAMYRHLERAWRAIGFVREETAPTVMRQFRRALGRAGLTGDEVTLLRGVARQTLWAARRAGLLDEPDGASEGDRDDDDGRDAVDEGRGP